MKLSKQRIAELWGITPRALSKTYTGPAAKGELSKKRQWEILELGAFCCAHSITLEELERFVALKEALIAEMEQKNEVLQQENLRLLEKLRDVQGVLRRFKGS